MEVRRDVALLAVTSLAALGGLASGGHSIDPTSVAEAQTMEAPATPDPELVAFCVEEAMGAEDRADFATMNPTRAVSSGYVGKSVRVFYSGVEANAVSEDCADVVTGREFRIDQIYKGRVNTPRSIVFNGLGKMTGEQRKTARLRVPFTGIKGPRVRAYKVKATETVTTTAGVFTKTGIDTVRGTTDGV